MRFTPTRRVGVLAGASALVLGLAVAPAAASEPTHIEGSTSSRPHAPREGRIASGADLRAAAPADARTATSSVAAAGARVDVKKVKAYHANLYDPSTNYIDVKLSLSDWSDVEQIDLDLKVSGKKKGSFPVLYDDWEDTFYVEIPGDIGLGTSVFTGSTIHYTDGDRPSTKDSTDSNRFNIRRGAWAVDYEDEFGDYWIAEYGAYGKHKYIEVYELLIYSPSAGDFVPLKSIKLQYKKGSKWKTKKAMKLRGGYGFYQWKTAKRYKYRLYSATTKTFEGFNLGPTATF